MHKRKNSTVPRKIFGEHIRVVFGQICTAHAHKLLFMSYDIVKILDIAVVFGDPGDGQFFSPEIRFIQQSFYSQRIRHAYEVLPIQVPDSITTL